MFLYAVGGSPMGQMLVIHFPPLQAVFQTEALYCTDILLLISVASSVFIVDEIRKFAIRTRLKRKNVQRNSNSLYSTGFNASSNHVALI